MEAEFKRTRQNKLKKELSILDTGNINIMKSIEKIDPKYAKHMFLKNQLIENFAMHMGGGVDLLEQPVCPSCEKPAAWNENATAYCFSCNKSIPSDKVITVMEYLIEYTNAFTEEQLEVLNMLGGSEHEATKQIIL